MAGSIDRLRACGPAAASLMANALLLAGLLSLGVGQMGRKVEASSLTVVSLTASRSEEMADEQEMVPEIKPSASSDIPVEPAIEVLPESVAQPVPAPMLPVTPVRAKPNDANVASAVPPAVATAPLNTPAPPKPAGPLPPASNDRGKGPSIKVPPGTSNSYAAKVRSWLYAHKIYPRRAKMRREEGKVRVRFVIDRRGALREGAVIDRSGNETLDAEATAMMHRASPYPKAPQEVPGELIEFVVPIEFTLPV